MRAQRWSGARACVCALVVLFACWLGGCGGATLVASAGGSDPYGPVNENRTGAVRYLSRGADFIIKGRREDAYKLMHEDCGGSYEIVSEGPHSTPAQGFLVSAQGSTTAYYGSSEEWYIFFRCAQPGGDEPTPPR